MDEADRIISECPQDRVDLALHHYGAGPTRIVVISCGFDPSEFRPISKPLARSGLGLDLDEPVVL